MPTADEYRAQSNLPWNRDTRDGDLLRAAADLAERVERVKALHHSEGNHGPEWCDGCGHEWPCPTVVAVTGEDDQ